MASIAARLAPLVALALAAPAARAAAQTTDTTTATPPAAAPKKKPRADRSEITREQIQASQFTTVYQLVQSLHSDWLRSSMGPSSFRKPTQKQAYLDDARLDGIESLKSIELAAVQYIHFYSPSEASLRWGIDHPEGAILVSTRPR